MNYILLGLILTYSCWVVYRKVKDFKKGKYCSCGCSECPSKIKCHK